MLTLDTLFDNDTDDAPSAKPVQGKWFEIQLAPDVVSGERLNIGVGFVRARSGQFHFRLLKTANPFVCLYGHQAREQFDFLLRSVEKSLAKHGPSAAISPQISFGKPRHMEGASPEAIVDSLYATVVTIGRRELALESLPGLRVSPRSTESVRLRVRKAFVSLDKHNYPRYWRDDPVELAIGKAKHRVDLSIWEEEGSLFNSRRFASIVSSCYRDTHYRDAYLKGAYHALTIARNYTRKSAKGVLIVLTPENDPAIPVAMKRTIENEIDDVEWVLKEKFDVKSFLQKSIESVRDKAMEFMS
jgi:hypothetical protein